LSAMDNRINISILLVAKPSHQSGEAALHKFCSAKFILASNIP
jgi:hypothetical protein